MSMRLTEDRTSAICARRATNKPVFTLIAFVFFGTTVSGCATVDATVERVKTGVSDRFNKDEVVAEPESASSLVEQQPIDSEPVVPAKKPLLVDIQEKLRALGYYSGAISGKLDSRTEAAIQDFQLDNDLRINGRPTESLLQALDKAIKNS